MKRYKNYSFWDFMMVLDKSMPLDKDALEVAFDDRFSKTKVRGLYYECKSRPIETVDGVIIDDITFVFSQKNDLKKGGFFYFDLDGKCIDLNALKENVHNIELHSGPSGHSANDKVVWKSARKWGELFFSFNATNPDCLASVAFKLPK